MSFVNPKYLVISSKAGRYGLKEIDIAGLKSFGQSQSNQNITGGYHREK